MQSWGGVNLQLEAEPVAAWNWRLGIPLSLAALLNTKFLAAPGDKMLFSKCFCKASVLLCLHYKLPKECSVSSWGSFGGQFSFWNSGWLNLGQGKDDWQISTSLPTPGLIFCGLSIRFLGAST